MFRVIVFACFSNEREGNKKIMCSRHFHVRNFAFRRKDRGGRAENLWSLTAGTKIVKTHFSSSFMFVFFLSPNFIFMSRIYFFFKNLI